MNRYAIAAAFLLLPVRSFTQTVPADRVARCETLLLTQAQAAQDTGREFNLDLTGPAGARLRYIGVRHTFDPADAQFVEMEQAWRVLQPSEAFYEGTGTFVGSTLQSSIPRSGEPGLVRYLAAQAGVPAHSLEPTREAEVQELLKSFTAEQLVLFYVARPVVELRDRRNLPPEALDTLLGQFLAAAHRIQSLAGVLPDLAAYRAAYARWFPDRDPRSTPTGWFDPLHTSAETGSRFVNDVNRASSAFRDLYMYRLLVSAWRPGVRLFAEVGRDHIPAQAAALRCALGS